ncbi:HAMP domain-containing histidine kinase [Candidatus Parcubacteria bacterium]|nr:HAMP domain-containing histidine kinase [Candidatus Parcubacteria bacterium]
MNYITMFTDMIDKDEIVTADGVETIFGDYYLIFVLHFIIFVSSIFVIPLCKYKRVNNLQRLQIKYFVFGTVLSIFIGALTNIVLPFAFNIYKLQLLGPLGLFFFFGFTTYAIVKHQLMDIRVIIQRGMIYSALLAVIVGVYIFFVFVLGFFFQQSSDTTVLFAAGLSVVLGIYGVPHLEKVFCKATDKIFFKNKYDYSQAIYELSEILNQNIELNKLLNKTIYKIQEIFKTSFVAIVLPKQNIILNTNESMRQTRELFTLELIKAIEAKNQPILLTEDIPEIANELLIKKANNADIKAINQAHKNAIKYGVEIYVSILLNQKLIGLIILTKKLSGDQYTPEDIKLFKTFSYQAAVALDKAKLFQQVKEYSEELERKVEKRTAKILGLQEEQKKMMQEMAHGLQTPITILKGELTQFNGIVKDNKKVRSIERSIDRVSDFIYGMLRLAKLESETKDGKKEKFNLSKLLNELIESYEIITSEKNIKIDHEIAKHINFFGNEKAIEEMITNLVSNSVKYMKEANDKKISLSLKQDQDSIRLIVADNGIGIDEQDIPKLFQRFYRVGDKEQGKQKGTGLGLAICKEIVQKHNGNIKVESERNKGTKFIITMPIAHF